MRGRNPYCNVACINDGVSCVGCLPKQMVDLVTRPNCEQDEEAPLAYSQTQIQNLLEGKNALIRQWVDEDWSEEKLIKPLLKEVFVVLGINVAFFPAEASGADMPEPMALSNVICEELAHIDSGFAVAFIGSVWYSNRR